jgi:nicotinamide-nucleotide amidase
VRHGSDAAALLDALADRGETLAVAESLTGGLLMAGFTAVPGASRVVRGGVVAYADEAKVTLLGVPADVVHTAVVSGETARAMAEGARDRCAATWALSTTGVAGPDPQEGKEPGTVYLGWAGPGCSGSERLHLAGDRATIREATCLAAIDLLARTLGNAGEDAML